MSAYCVALKFFKIVLMFPGCFFFFFFTASEGVRERSHETFNYMANSIILNFMKLFLGRVDSNI